MRDALRPNMHIIWVLLIGLVVGALAKLVMPGKDPGGIIITIVIGIVGSFIANFIGRAAGWYGPTEPAGFIASIVGAVILLAGYRMITGRRAR
ncbi:MAG: GlsB/YeaQ/YmgE family stress response membrane protein [Kofleriaceae bacterium]